MNVSTIPTTTLRPSRSKFETSKDPGAASAELAGDDEVTYNRVGHEMCHARKETEHAEQRREISQMGPVIDELVKVDGRFCIIRHSIGGVLRAHVSQLVSAGNPQQATSYHDSLRGQHLGITRDQCLAGELNRGDILLCIHSFSLWDLIKFDGKKVFVPLGPEVHKVCSLNEEQCQLNGHGSSTAA